MMPADINPTHSVASKRRSIWKISCIGCFSLLGLFAILLMVVYYTGGLGGWHMKIDREPVFSPDGSRIAFTSLRKGNLDIFVVNSDGKDLRQLTADPLAAFDLINHNSDFAPDWSPDGQHIIFTSYRENSNIFGDYSFVYIYMMNPDGSNVQKWWASDWWNHTTMDPQPDWSPDGKRIAFSANDDGYYYGQDVFYASVEPAVYSTRRLTSLTNSFAQYPAWSPNGRLIAFVDHRNYGSLQQDIIYVIDLIGETKQIASGDHPTWSPDGQRIAFSRKGTVNSDIYVINADGSGEIQLTHNAGDNITPDWSPDGSKIVFSSSRNGDTLLYIMNTDGSNVLQITY